MPSYKSLLEQYVTLHFCLGGLTEASTEVDVDAVMPIHNAAYELMRKRERGLPGRIGFIDDIEVDNFELCEDDVELTGIEGHLTHGMSFYSRSHISNETVRALHTAVRQAYEDSRTSAGHPELDIRFIEARRQNVMRVSETSAFDIEEREPEVAEC